MVALFDLYLALIEQQIKMMIGDKKNMYEREAQSPLPLL
jgi:hypothetical protein